MEPTTPAKYFHLANIYDRCLLQLRNELHRDDELGAVCELYMQMTKIPNTQEETGLWETS
jgi:hypothetical protein